MGKQIGNRVSEIQAHKWMKQIASAFQMMKSDDKIILHRDIKPEVKKKRKKKKQKKKFFFFIFNSKN